jgi:hypothetical protein
MAAIIGGGWRSRSGHAPARRNWGRRWCNRRTKIFSPHAHDGAIALNLNLAQASLVQSLNQHGNQ